MEFGSLLDLPESGSAHAHEHSGEVLLPFIQHYFKGHPFGIVPICMADQSFERASELGTRIFHASQRLEKCIMVLASSDFSHFLTSEEGYNADQPVVDAICSGDIEGVYSAVTQRRVTVCGYGPIMALMTYSALLDPSYNTHILARGHSGEVSPSREVVDYISFLMCN
jgi:AmmeMemoRadiSam system protein B